MSTANNMSSEGLIVLGHIQKTVDKMDTKLDSLIERQSNFERETDTRITKLESKNDHRGQSFSFLFSLIAALAALVACLKSFAVL